MAPNLPDLLGRGFDRGLEAAFTADSITQLVEAVDFEALERGDPGAMDFERMGELVGQMTGRLVVKQTVGRYTPGQFAEQTVGYAIGGAIGREGGRLVLQVVEDQYGDPVEVDIDVLDEGEVEESDDIRDLGDGEDVDGLDDLGGGLDGEDGGPDADEE
ncbi:hypothetical protein HAPAU_08710 [Halalkalicoccus paucihalophilus]|uniref:Uncharacterized protein n=1 Tax=Halalkalicoccus paucihalophilus TaxID=1008153 RepID=A0A151AH88_9EURY|nr:hypothetical protein [Halalkalicoccus paucihalophilus]KYH26983.1 hypothetical protein HAPAU_08710 [Halalkalicoccus paucihalophilus]